MSRKCAGLNLEQADALAKPARPSEVPTDPGRSLAEVAFIAKHVVSSSAGALMTCNQTLYLKSSKVLYSKPKVTFLPCLVLFVFKTVPF